MLVDDDRACVSLVVVNFSNARDLMQRQNLQHFFVGSFIVIVRSRSPFIRLKPLQLYDHQSFCRFCFHAFAYVHESKRNKKRSLISFCSLLRYWTRERSHTFVEFSFTVALLSFTSFSVHSLTVVSTRSHILRTTKKQCLTKTTDSNQFDYSILHVFNQNSCCLRSLSDIFLFRIFIFSWSLFVRSYIAYFDAFMLSHTSTTGIQRLEQYEKQFRQTFCQMEFFIFLSL